MCQNESMEDVGNIGWFTSPPSPRPPFLFERTCFELTPVQRLIAAGIRPDCAAETVMWYQAQGDDEGLEKYIAEIESRFARNGEVYLAQRKPV